MTTEHRTWSPRARLAITLAGVVLVLGVAVWLSLMTPGPKKVRPVPEQPPAGAIEATPEVTSGEAATKVAGKTAKVRLEVRPGRVREGERPSMKMVNIGELELSYGTPFKLELRTPTGWHWVNKHQAFNLPLFFLAEGEETESEEIGMYVDTPQPLPFAPGKYRVSKTFDIDVHDEAAPSLRVSAIFEIARADGSRDPLAGASDPFVPYPGSQWYGPRGEPLPMKEERINVITGPDHCEWQSAAMLHANWPLGSAEKDANDNLQYIRDPQDAMGTRMAELFEANVPLPPGARYTGYRTEFMELWVRTYERGIPVVATARPPDRIYLVYADHVESWPRARDSIACG